MLLRQKDVTNSKKIRIALAILIDKFKAAYQP